MSYKSILVQVDQTTQSRERIRLAAAIAENEQAHLIGTAMTGISHLVFEEGAFNQAVRCREFGVGSCGVVGHGGVATADAS